MNYKRDILEFEKFLKAESLVVEQFKYMDARNYLNGLYEKIEENYGVQEDIFIEELL